MMYELSPKETEAIKEQHAKKQKSKAIMRSIIMLILVVSVFAIIAYNFAAGDLDMQSIKSIIDSVKASPNIIIQFAVICGVAYWAVKSIASSL